MTASDFENLCNDIATARLVEENSNIPYDDMFDGDKLKKNIKRSLMIFMIRLKSITLNTSM